MASGLVVVQQYERMIVQRLGTYVGLKRPGLHFLIPIIDNGTKVDLRERVIRVPT
ncbi:MAG: SPFH/Band 7/PHB domain protein, partial [Chloroflexi bacterium]|nr:SPFH/Band 7/PHB domain protein [Chloroflexota bacterium]